MKTMRCELVHVYTTDKMYYHPECYIKHLKEEENNG